jgi:Spy/CpxP family protein refolding chaperone
MAITFFQAKSNQTGHIRPKTAVAAAAAATAATTTAAATTQSSLPPLREFSGVSGDRVSVTEGTVMQVNNNDNKYQQKYLRKIRIFNT